MRGRYTTLPFIVATFIYLRRLSPQAGLELVLTAHSLLCTFPLGYLRFGAETRAFLNRLADFILFPGAALAGVVGQLPGCFKFVVCDPFMEFLATRSEYAPLSEELLVRASRVSPMDDLLWPLSRQGWMFELLAATSREYGLPTTSDTIILDPHAPEFIGFKRPAPHELEFREGRNAVRCTAEAIEFLEDGKRSRTARGIVLAGWALDSQGRVCGLCRTPGEPVLPPETGLIRLLLPQQWEREGQSLTILALDQQPLAA